MKTTIYFSKHTNVAIKEYIYREFTIIQRENINGEVVIETSEHDLQRLHKAQQLNYIKQRNK
jgi:hypothetical protein